jgi:hypothetical protein
MEAEQTLDPKKLAEELEKMTEVSPSLFSGLKLLSLQKKQS